MVKFPIYMDHHATTPLDPRVLEAMLPFLTEHFGNASSEAHAFGKTARAAVENARAEAAVVLGVKDTEEIIFTGGATESNNLAIKGAAAIYRDKGNHIITTEIEHRSVLESCRALERDGFRVTYLPVTAEGRIEIDVLRKSITPQTILISVMAVNNEIGVIQDLEAIGKIAREQGILFHVDAAQALGRMVVDVEKMRVDLLSFSGHKIYGPKGTGVLFRRKKNPRVRLQPLVDGGGHEQGIRPGTLNVPGIVGLGKACEIISREMTDENERILGLRQRLWDTLSRNLDEIYLNGSAQYRTAGNLNVSFAYVEGESLLQEIAREIAVSSGSACMSADREPSYVLKALNMREDLIHTSIRFGLGRFNTAEEVDAVADKVIRTVKRMREESPMYTVFKETADK